MAENTNIKWATHTHNRWIGCARKSEACRFCYAESFVTNRMRLPVWGVNAPRKPTSESTRKLLFRWNKKALVAGERHRVFCSSLCDVFEDRPDLATLRAGLFRDIEACHGLDFLLLTKRPERMLDLAREAGWSGDWPRNVWAGCTVENQKCADERIPHLLHVPAKIRFLSMEPLLEEVDLSHWLCIYKLEEARTEAERAVLPWARSVARPMNQLHMIITGGESGPHSRPFNIAWARSLRKQCKAAKAAFFCKQLGSNPVITEGSADAKGWGADGATGRCDDLGNIHLRHGKGEDMNEWPLDLRVQEFPS